MARKSKTAKAAKKARTRAAWVPSWGGVTRAATSAATVVIVAGMVVGLTVGRAPLQARAATFRQKDPRTPTVVIQWPSWAGMRLDPLTRATLEKLALDNLSRDPFDSASLAKVQAALTQTGWFIGPCVVTRDATGVVRVDGTWRAPFAVVRTGRGDRWVTYRGEALDKVFPEGTSGLCVITGVKAAGPAKAGEAWPGGEVQAAAALLQYIRETPGFDQVKGIDASKFSSKGELAIVTTDNTRIVWGGPVDRPRPGEKPSAVKMRYLADVFARYGRLDGGQAELDLPGLGAFGPGYRESTDAARP